MLRVTKLTDYGIAMMTRLVDLGDQKQATAPDLSRDMGLPLPTVRKILKTLTQSELLVSTRGITGGYSLARKPEEITLMELVEALEGPIILTDCSTDEPCGCKVRNCGLRKNWSWVNELLRDTLESYSLAEMCGSLAGLQSTRMK